MQIKKINAAVLREGRIIQPFSAKPTVKMNSRLAFALLFVLVFFWIGKSEARIIQKKSATDETYTEDYAKRVARRKCMLSIGETEYFAPRFISSD